MKNTLILFALAAVLASCISRKKFDSAVSRGDRLRADSTAFDARVKELQSQLFGLEGNVQMTAQELDAKKRELQQKDAELKEKAARMDELDRRIRAQDDAMNGLRKKVADALVNFKAEDLSVHMKDGKVYVSLSEKLLFPSGSATVEPGGKEALGKLASVLVASTDIEVMVEGHTDSIPIRTARFADNWELSTARANSIVRILTKDHGVDPHRVGSSGHGEFQPVASNSDAQGRQRNRRTEIILIPKLEELYDMVGQGARP